MTSQFHQHRVTGSLSAEQSLQLDIIRTRWPKILRGSNADAGAQMRRSRPSWPDSDCEPSRSWAVVETSDRLGPEFRLASPTFLDRTPAHHHPERRHPKGGAWQISLGNSIVVGRAAVSASASRARPPGRDVANNPARHVAPSFRRD